jgi:putative MATE family efflux protein
VLVGTVLNIVLDPLLIFGAGPLPHLGVLGAAIATVVSELVVLAAWVVLWARGAFPLPLRTPEALRSFSRVRAGQIVRIGAPEAVIEALFSVVYLVLSHLTGAFGAATTAALGIVNRLESITYLTAAAMGLAVATMVGQNLGARRPDRAEASAHRGALLITALAGTFTVLFLVAPGTVVRLFTADPDVTAEAVTFLRIVAVSQIFMGWELVYGQAFVGAGDTLPPMHVSVTTSVIRVPLAWWLAFHTSAGTAGIWWTISLTCILRGVLLVIWFRLGRWKSKDLQLAPLPLATPVPIGPEGPEG